MDTVRLKHAHGQSSRRGHRHKTRRARLLNWRWIVLALAAVLLAAILLFLGGRAALSLQENVLVTQEIRYTMPEAGEVFLVWGLNGWEVPPEETWPEGTRLVDDTAHTPMTVEGDTFVARLHVPAWSSFNFGFLITKTKEGAEAGAWEVDGEKAFQVTTSQKDGVVAVQSKISLNPDPQPEEDEDGAAADVPLVNQEIRYRMPEAGEVFLVWGLEGWELAPEETWPAGTTLVEDVTHTPMLLEGEAFVARLRLPPGETVNYGFLTTRKKDGGVTDTWEADGERAFQLVTGQQDGVTEVQAKIFLGTEQAPAATTSAPPAFGSKGVLLVGAMFLVGLLIIIVTGFLFRRPSA